MNAAPLYGRGLDEMTGLDAAALERGMDGLTQELANGPAYTAKDRARLEVNAQAYAAEFSAVRVREARRIAKLHGCSMRGGRCIPGFQLTKIATGEVVGGPRSKAAMLTPGDVARVFGGRLLTEDVL
ncbi:hypothetical protein [Methylobacterium sp. 22177]|uniref:hypothetical protein n=1 Tax=Methylobacterium sp. 22177 TaxID=3453885 RepID=UPI003F86FC15